MTGKPECEDRCVTCGDVAVRGTVERLLADDMAIVRLEGFSFQEVSVALVTVRVGETVLLHAGEAIAVVPRD